ncbi:metal ABC transporter permease [Spongiibacter sp. KMU-158]|uniref:High-affinity zinc uptake system membrane protein ZnuB n=1 Tax=Spongiibacter pelagi TaxID=2760804 RepID=A0A927GUP2_9GAMM|nr:iron chelate uptake ABC transporter family permease subunit [Spongiibacter pelagi]MBD2857555.1 metal ABC transporter permease [Spongiibacter pelagi]
MTDLLIYAALAGLLLALICGPLGSLVTWQGMAYFGDTLAHSALLGLALGLFLDTDLNIAVLFTSLLIAALLFLLQWRNPRQSLDSLLGILSHSSLALGLVVLSLLSNAQFDLSAFLFGDLLSVNQQDLYLLLGIVVVMITLLIRFWGDLVSMTAHAELAAVEGLPVKRLRLLMMLMIAGTVAVAMKIVGVLLITAMLIIPASTAGRLARNPEQSAFIAIALGWAAVLGGLTVAWYADTPAGPSVVLSAAGFYALSFVFTASRRAV